MTHSMAVKLVTACGIGALVLCLHSPSTAKIQEDAWLITPEEAAMAPRVARPGEPLTEVGGEDLLLGPQIELLKPTNGGRAPTPVEILVKFVVQAGKVDLASLKVSLVKFISIDITDRVREHVTADGIHVKEAKIPSGKHTVRISLADIDGLLSVKTFTFEVF